MSLSSYEVIWKQVLDQVEQSNFFTEDTLRWIKNTTLLKLKTQLPIFLIVLWSQKQALIKKIPRT